MRCICQISEEYPTLVLLLVAVIAGIGVGLTLRAPPNGTIVKAPHWGMSNLTDMDALTKQTRVVQNALNLANARHTVISNNLANVNAPGYVAQEIAFNDELADALREDRTSKADFRQQIQVGGEVQAKVNGNTVDMDHELTALAKNAVTHRTMTEILSRQIAMMRTAITGQQ